MPSFYARVHLCIDTSVGVSRKAYGLPKTSIDLNLDQIFIQMHEGGTKLDLNLKIGPIAKHHNLSPISSARDRVYRNFGQMSSNFNLKII